MDLGRAGADWHGYYIEDGRLYTPAWKRGFKPGEIQALPYLAEARRTYEKELSRLKEEVLRLEAEIEQHKGRAQFYRRQLVLEARYGLMLARVT